jgi:hypothetical protein
MAVAEDQRDRVRGPPIPIWLTPTGTSSSGDGATRVWARESQQACLGRFGIDKCRAYETVRAVIAGSLSIAETRRLCLLP